VTGLAPEREGSDPHGRLRPHTGAEVQGSAPNAYAGIVTRGCAFAADVAIVQASVFAVGAVIALIAEAFGEVSIDISALEAVLGALAWIAVFDVYLISFWWLAGQTPGMRILGIDVRTVEGARVPPKRGVLRLVGMVLAAIPFFAGYVPIMLNERRQGFHDKLARTVVRYRAAEPVRRRP
jgi:uncharacterized RDD family membrane protein YckC